MEFSLIPLPLMSYLMEHRAERGIVVRRDSRCKYSYQQPSPVVLHVCQERITVLSLTTRNNISSPTKSVQVKSEEKFLLKINSVDFTKSEQSLISEESTHYRVFMLIWFPESIKAI